MKFLIVPLTLLLGAPSAFAVKMRFSRDQERPADLARFIGDALSKDSAPMFYDHVARVMQVSGPLDLSLPALPKSRRGRFLMNLHRILHGERVADDVYAILSKHASVTLHNGLGTAIDWYALDFTPLRITPVPNATSLVEQVFAAIPKPFAEVIRATNTLKLKGHLEIDLSAFDRNVRASYRGHLDVIFNGGRAVNTYTVDAGDAAIVYLPEDEVPSASPERPLSYTMTVRRQPGWGIDECAYQNLRDFERWLKNHGVPPTDVVLEIEDQSLDASVRPFFRREVEAYIKRGRLPDGLSVPPRLIVTPDCGSRLAP